jgi:hypothetical protein
VVLLTLAVAVAEQVLVVLVAQEAQEAAVLEQATLQMQRLALEALEAAVVVVVAQLQQEQVLAAQAALAS